MRVSPCFQPDSAAWQAPCAAAADRGANTWQAPKRCADGRLALALSVQRHGVIQSLHDPLVQRLQPGTGSSM